MQFYRHHPPLPLARYIDHFWFFEGLQLAHSLEKVVPDGSFELIIDLRETPRKLFDSRELSRFQTYRRGWISGAHSKFIVIDVLPDASMIGARFKPGGAAPWLGMPADELTDRVEALDAVWNRDAGLLREQLLEARGAQRKFRILEGFLRSRLDQCSSFARNQARVEQALALLCDATRPGSVAEIAKALGVSHKHLIEEFRGMVGLTPKLFGRIRRFQDVLGKIHARQTVEWADLACACGYYDQPHFVRDFQVFAGINPTAFIRHDLDDPKFIPHEA